MSPKKQIYYYADSPAASLVKSLGKKYELCPWQTSAARRSTKSFSMQADGKPAVWLADAAHGGLRVPRAVLKHQPGLRLIALTRKQGDGNGPAVRRFPAKVFVHLPRGASSALVERVVELAFANIELAERERVARLERREAERAMEELNQIGVALSSERDLDALLRLILQNAREITRADAGSLYLVEEEETGERHLRFKLTQNDSRNFGFAEFTLPLTEDSLAGYVALRGKTLNLPDAYNLPRGLTCRFNPYFDESSGYRTRSLLSLPMKNTNGEVLGVLQLINSKRNPAARLKNVKEIERDTIPFSKRSARMALSLASQAAVALENSRLYAEIEMLFEGFVKASVKAIEERDPATSGHSFRVAALTLGLAETVNATISGPYRSTCFTPEQTKEIRYAALLHDFGKVGVREEILVKARKLYPMQLELVRQRFDYIRKELEANFNRQKIDLLLGRGRENALAEMGLLDQEFERRLKEIENYFQFILRANEPTVQPANHFERLARISEQTFCDPGGQARPYLEPEEARFLSIPQGTLDAEERRQIESHVVHSFNFLIRIPWTRELHEIPAIVRAHHEKLDGSGYPYKLRGGEIPLPTKMMTICDIYDALSAADRPYKKALSAERALGILEQSVRMKELDAELFRLFVEAKIYERTAGSS